MGEVEELLRTTATQFEPELRSRLDGFLGGIIRAYLPQAWEFRTEHETVTLEVDANGAVRVHAGPAAKPDVTIEIPKKRLVVALTTRRREAVPPGPLTATPHTTKGRAAFDYLRGRLGL
jgi:hypothetical protein